MKKFMLLCLSIFVLGGTFPAAFAQFHGDYFVGDALSQNGTAIATRPISNPIILGNTSLTQGLVRSRAMSFSENNTIGTINVLRYDFGVNNIRFQTAANSSSNSLVGAAGFCRLSGETTDEAFFADVANGLSDDAQQMVLFVNPGLDRANKVIELSDNSFVVVGSNTNGTVGTSWVARLGSRPSYDFKFYRTLGNLTGPSSGGEGATAVAQAADGNILVAGVTFQSSTSAQGSIYIAKLSTLGALLEYHTYTIGGGVLGPRVTDMTLMSDGSLVLVGNTNIPNDADHYGFIMTVTSNLASATFQEVLQPGITTFGQVFGAVVPQPNSSNYFVAGTIQRLVSGVVNEDGLLIKVLPGAGTFVVKAMDISGGNEQFQDMAILRDGTTLEVVGTADALPSGTSGPAGNNIFTQRSNFNLDACGERAVSIELDLRPVTHATPVPVSSTGNPTRYATLTLSEVQMESVRGCIGAARLSDPTATTAATPQLLPDPDRHVAALHLGKQVTTAQVTLSDARGHLLRQWVLAGPDLDIALDGLDPGLYFVAVLDGTQESTLKLTVQ